jgi:hypothetical protein
MVPPVEQGGADLEEALGYATEGGYRIYEADIRIARAWTFLAQAHVRQARASAERARQLSAELGYHWGRVDADEVLALIDTLRPNSQS